MDLFKRPQSFRIINTTVAQVALAGVALWTLLLLSSASKLSGNVTTATVVHGPLGLFQLSKTPLSTGGYQATMQFYPGLPIYISVTVLIAIALIAYRLHSAPQAEQE